MTTTFEYTDSALENVKVYETSLWFAEWGTDAAIGMNACHTLKVTKHGVDNWEDIPNKFASGDVIICDCGSGEISVNGVTEYGLGALGNDWEKFCLEPGNNFIRCLYSQGDDWPSAVAPTFTLKYRKVWL